jgi:hypothetical protein
VPPGRRPGFAIDLANIGAPCTIRRETGHCRRLRRGNGVIGSDPAKPDFVVAANGGSDLIYIPGKSAEITGKVVSALLAQDYVSGLFVDDALGSFPGTLPRRVRL